MLRFGLGHGIVEQKGLHVDFALIICHLILQVVCLGHRTRVN